MLQEGLYKVAFQTPLGHGAGVVTLREGKLAGGDSSMYYRGAYDQNGDRFVAKVVSDVHTRVPGIGSVFGKDHATINLTGSISGDTAQMTGTAIEAPGVTFQATLTRLSD